MRIGRYVVVCIQGAVYCGVLDANQGPAAVPIHAGTGSVPGRAGGGPRYHRVHGRGGKVAA